MIQKFVRYELLGYRPYQRLRPEDIGTHELHISCENNFVLRSFASPYVINAPGVEWKPGVLLSAILCVAEQP
jgi:hypothetical protein